MADSYIKRLIDAFEARPEKVAMRVVGDDRQVYTFGESLSAIRSIAYRLGEHQIEKGDRVALIGENHPCWALAYLGTLYHGAVCVPLDPHGEIETLTNFVENSEAKLAFLSPDFTPKFNEIEEKLGRHIPAVVWDLETSENGFQRFDSWSEAGFPSEFAAREQEIAAALGGADCAQLNRLLGRLGGRGGMLLGELLGLLGARRGARRRPGRRRRARARRGAGGRARAGGTRGTDRRGRAARGRAARPSRWA